MAEPKWKEISQEGQATTWKPTEVGESISGVFSAKREGIGANKSVVYEIKTDEDEMIAVWDTTVLSNKLSQVPLGHMVKITYLGAKKSKTRPGNYHDFRVETADPVTVDEDLPF